MNIGFIGCGNMATAIISGIIENKAEESKNIFAYDVYSPALDKIKSSFNVNVCDSEQSVAEISDIIFLAVKPNVLGEVLNKIKDTANKSKKVLVSIVAGKTIEFITDNSTDKCKIIRVMPNINAKVSEAISAYCCNELVTDEDKSAIEKLLSSIGKVLALDESFFPIFGVIGGCAPAYAYMFIDALARAGVKNGLKKKDALMIAAQTVYGSAKMILESDTHPWELIDNVCSPGGTTIEGVTSLQADGFESAVHNAVDKAFEKDKKL
ncbi:MAG: pyrroline-5-carboxylate reductase [Clostridiales bacterium]|nr:pyrroline-5-carboxylate reductase [Clostridiales bacterium]